jgi:magnesium transporter
MGLALGAFLALLGYLFALVLIDNPPSPFQKLIVPITLMLVVMAATLCGGILPLVFRRLGLDPALMSNPFGASIIDVAGILIYMTVAVAMLGELKVLGDR